MSKTKPAPSWHWPHLNDVIRAVATALLVALGIYLFVRFGLSGFRGKDLMPTDFSVFYRAATRYLSDQPVYIPQESSPYKYSPIFLTLFGRFFALMPIALAWPVWCAVSVATWLSAIFALIWATAPLAYRLPAFLSAFAIALVASWHGHLEHLSYGQADFLMAALMVWATLLSSRRAGGPRIALGGFFVAVALLAKPAVLFMLIGVAWYGEMALLAAVIAWLFALATVSTMVMAFDGTPWSFTGMMTQWLDSLGQQPQELFSGNLNQAFGAVLARGFGHPEWAPRFCQVFFIGGLVLFSVALGRGLWRRRKSQPPLVKTPFNVAQKLSVSLGIYLLCNPLSWRWNTFLWFPMAYLAVMLYLARRTTPVPMVWRLLYNGLLLAFLLCVTVLQTHVAHFIGIAEVDTLSYWGLYGWGTLFLTAALVIDENAYRDNTDPLPEMHH